MVKSNLATYGKLSQALSDENRLRIVMLLRKHELCHCELQPVLGIAASTLSQHVKILMDVGLIQQRKDGKWRYFKLIEKPGGLQKDLLKTLDAYVSDDQIVADEAALGCVDCGPKGRCHG